MNANVMLLAAGRSTRLGALGLALPKPLVPICGHPAIAYGLRAAARAGARRAVVNVFHRGDLVQAALGDGRALGVVIDYSVETDLLGTGGGIAAARARLGSGPALVMNAKVVADLDLPALLAEHAGHHAVATMLLRDDPDPVRWGAIGVDATGRVVSILDARSPRPPEGAVTLRMFTGVQLLAPALMDRLQPIFCDLIRDAYVPALRDGETIRASTLTGYFAEHSTPARYLAGNLALLRDPELLRDPPGTLAGVDPEARVAAGARLVAPVRIAAGVEIEAGAEVGPDVVVDPGARVIAGARLRRAVVWSGATATGEISEAVVTPTGVVAIEGD
ncbi:MAG TPA: NDP-sugar synthase [Polyangia bacterium]|jgi:NDP-sugar pyrophosphorylase family protein|nr:NDP-sugar synthase [Polyangia bacterium]